MSSARMRLRYLTLAFSILVSWCCLAGPSISAHAAGTVLNTGFENYALAPLQGQFGWVTAGAGTSSATVQSSITHTGAKAVEVVKAAAANTDRRWAVPMSGLPTQRFVIIDWDMRVTQATNSSAFGPFLGIEAYDADVAPYVLGSLGVDASTGDVLYQLADSGVLAETGTVVSFNQWYHYRMILDFAQDEYHGFVNGNTVLSEFFVDRAFNLDNFTDADIATFAAAGDPVSQTASASAVFDNLLIRDGLLGDYDEDGNVDSADFTKWRQTFGSTVPQGTMADGSKNSVVDAADYVIWRKNLGASIWPSSGSGSLVVPEPALWLHLLTLAPAALLARRRRRAGGSGN